MKDKVLKFLPDFGKEVIGRVEKMWNWSTGFPVPTFEIKCPICGSDELIIHWWHFFIRREGSNKYRCEIGFKCTSCSAMWPHALAIPEELYKLHCADYKGRQYLWREVKEILRG